MTSLYQAVHSFSIMQRIFYYKRNTSLKNEVYTRVYSIYSYMDYKLTIQKISSQTTNQYLLGKNICNNESTTSFWFTGHLFHYCKKIHYFVFTSFSLSEDHLNPTSATKLKWSETNSSDGSRFFPICSSVGISNVENVFSWGEWKM